jgi:RHS repeat-associated protein
VPAIVSLGLALLVFDVSCHGGGGTQPGIEGAVYYHQDHLQGVALQTDEQGAVLAETAFDPFGGDLQVSTEPYAFTGKERDPDTGLYHFGARVYDPKLGLFLSPDPAVLEDPALAIEDPQLLGVYGYARNNPTTHIDPDGRFAHILIGALVGGGIGGGAYLVKAAITGHFSWRGALAATGGGAAAGAIAAATAGVGLLVSGAASGIGGGIVQRGIETGSVPQTLSPKAIAVDAALGVGSAVAAKAAAVVAPKVAGAVKSALARGRASAPSAAVARAAHATLRSAAHQAVPLLSRGPGGKMLREAVDVLKNTAPAGRVGMARDLFGQIEARSTSYWRAAEMNAADRATAWVGDTHTLVIDGTGQVFSGPHVGGETQIGVVDGKPMVSSWSGLKKLF